VAFNGLFKKIAKKIKKKSIGKIFIYALIDPLMEMLLIIIRK
jgi:hypothetical protein